MYKAKLTKKGAERIKRPHLAGEVFEYEDIHPLGSCVKGLKVDGLSLILSFIGEEPGVILVTRPSG